MKNKRNISQILIVAGALALHGCNSSSVGGAAEDIPGALAAKPADELIRDSLLSYYTSNDPSSGGISSGNQSALVEVATDSADSSAPEAGSVSRFSDTNVQESGVDESDRIKIDGNVLYALETPDLGYVNYGLAVPEPFLVDAADLALPYQPHVETLSAYKLDGQSSSVLSRLPLQELTGRSVSGMYLYNGTAGTDLLLLSGQSFYPWDAWARSDAFGGLETRVSWIDADDPSALSANRTIDIEGHLISSRRIDNRLILVTRFHPQLDGVIPYAYTDADIENNRNVINNADAADFLPVISITENGATTQRPAIGSNECYSRTADNSDGTEQGGAASSTYYYPSPSVISIITIDLDNPDTGFNSTCFVGDSETLYVSPQSVYLATTEYNYSIFGGFPVAVDDVVTTTATDTVTEDTTNDSAIDAERQSAITTHIHKFSFNGAGAPVFKGTGSVKGHLGWNPERKPFRLSEKDNNLRVVTFDQSLEYSPVTLSILRESGGSLATLSTLPNRSRPDPIGKPGESLYASRFIGDKAYLVTFRVTDPLYVLDVSNPRDPRIAGELEIPGYSDYLHPVNDSLLIGLGKDATPDTTGGFGDGRGAWYQGVKVSLYDVADPANPFVADERIFGKRGTESPALLQHHSFAYLAGNGDQNARFAIPLSLADGAIGGGPWSFANWSSNNLLTMEVDESSNRFVETPNWTFESNAAGFQYAPIGLENDRAVIGADNDLYLIHNGTLHYGLWGSSEPSLSIITQ